MKCPCCGRMSMKADNSKYGVKMVNSTLYVCQTPGCGHMVRKDRKPRVTKSHRVLKGQIELIPK